MTNEKLSVSLSQWLHSRQNFINSLHSYQQQSTMHVRTHTTRRYIVNAFSALLSIHFRKNEYSWTKLSLFIPSDYKTFGQNSTTIQNYLSKIW